MTRFTELTHDSPTHPLTARDLMLAISRRAVPGRGTPHKDRGRSTALSLTCSELAAVTPEHISGWALISYYLLAPMARYEAQSGKPLAAVVARSVTLAECFAHAKNATLECAVWLFDEVPIDVVGALELADVWLEYLDGMREPTDEPSERPRYEAMYQTMLRERMAIAACQPAD